MAADAAIYPPGSRVGLAPPAGMKLSPRLQGFEDTERKAGIAIVELPARAFEAIEKTAFSDAPNKNGIVTDKRERLPFANGKAFLITGHQDVAGIKMHKWLYVVGTPSLTAIVTADVPEGARATYPDDAIRKALASITLRPAPVAEQLALIPFKVGQLSNFRVVRVLPAGVVLLTEGPKDDDTPDQPFVILSVGTGAPEDTGARERMARQLLASGTTLKDLRFTVAEAMRIGGQPGYEVRGEGKDPKTGTPMMIVQWLRFIGNAYLRVVGVTRTEKWPEMFPRFRAVRDGLEPK